MSCWPSPPPQSNFQNKNLDQQSQTAGMFPPEYRRCPQRMTPSSHRTYNYPEPFIA